ncbi:M28 family peptidase [Adhaeribacter radiodurans]|uniref:Carboxypeptidase Q n=1 Tax=Adhaeribacter radiodurans TaxID=2745197 RepID=A0A7L7LA40_9BACT|nr:M28 family peptidase [Adhaeribacter radiodurans]QMU29712.1 M28 family peptidase [Adhaeribacter radiodurans]
MLHKIKILTCSLLLSLPVTAQENSSWGKIFNRINAEVQQNSKAYSTLQQASATIGHRLTGSENGKKAEEYAYNLLKSYGFEKVRYQPFEVESWRRGELRVQIGTDADHLQDIKSVSLAHSPVKAELTAAIVDMGNGLEVDYQAKPGAVTEKIALVYLGVLPGSAPGTGTLHRSEKTALAKKYGASGIIIINTVAGGTLLTGTASVTGKLIPIPAVCIGKEDGLKLKEQLRSGPLVSAINMTNFSGLINARNVIATLPGATLPKEKIVVGGHLDTWDLATGAIDNGLGSFSVIDMARTFKTLKLRPKRTIEFVLFMGEEEGLLGSEAYVAEAMKDKSMQNIAFMLNYDMTNDPKGYHATSEACKPLFQTIGALASKIDTTFKNNFSSRAGLHSDHQPFMLHGVPTGGSFGGKLPAGGGDCYHADCDGFDLVEESGLKNTVRFSSMLVYGLADSVKIPAKHLNDSETKAFLITNKLQEPLKIAGEWRWAD